MPELTSVHRQFIQTCSSRSAMIQKEALEAFQPIWRAEHSRAAKMDDMVDCIDTINAALAEFSQKICVQKFDLTDTHYVMFTDTTESSSMKHQTTFTEQDLHFFRVLLRELATADDYAIEFMAAINATRLVPASGSGSITKDRAEKLIDTWISKGYFFNLDDVLHFGPRCLAEFGAYLQKHFAEHVFACMLCKLLAMKFVKCVECEETFHSACLRNYMKKTSKCPKCKKNWTVPIPN